MNRKLLLLTTLISGFSISAAQAGFEWTPPPMKAAAIAPSNMPQENSAPSDMGGPLTPMPGEMSMATAKVEPVTETEIMDNGPQVAPVTQTQPGMRSLTNEPQNITAQNTSESDVMLPVPGEMPMSSIMPSTTIPPQNPAMVEGFGKDIPLAVALRQVVPPIYTVAFDSGIDQGKPVSWNGGNTWDAVVSDMLRSRKLHATISANVITVSKGTGSDLMLPAPSMMAQNSPAMDSMDPVAVSGARPVLDMGMQKHWTAPSGQGLKETLQDWSRQAGVELAWQDAKDTPINSAFSYDGTFDQAVDALLSLHSGNANEPSGKLYPNLPEGPSVLVIGSN